MGSHGNATVDEVIADDAPDLPSPHCLAAPERAAPDRVSEVTFPIFVHSTSIYDRKTQFRSMTLVPP